MKAAWVPADVPGTAPVFILSGPPRPEAVPILMFVIGLMLDYSVVPILCRVSGQGQDEGVGGKVERGRKGRNKTGFANALKIRRRGQHFKARR